MSLEPGDPAPTVSARNQHGDAVGPSFEEPTVVYFYPRDDTPGCTTEATEFTGELETYRAAGVTVYGVSVDDVDSHADFAEKYGIEFDLLADPDGEVADAFDVERRRGGTTARTTFVLVDGRVHEVYTGVDPSGHARQVLSDLADDGVVALE
ncbi:MAG: peroxiredoxin [Haloferacaceae archaeon]